MEKTKLVDIIDILSKSELEEIGSIIGKMMDANSKAKALYNNSEIMLEVFNCIYYNDFTIHKGLYSELDVVSYHDRVIDIFLKIVTSDKTEECKILMRRTDIDKKIDILKMVNAIFSKADKLLNDFDLYRDKLFDDDYTLIDTFDNYRIDLLNLTIPHILTSFNLSDTAEKFNEAGINMNHIDTPIGNITCIGLVSTIETNPAVKVDYAEVEYILAYRKANNLFLARVATDTEMNFRGVVGMGLDEDRFIPLTLEEQISMYREAIDLIVLYIHSMDTIKIDPVDKVKLN